MLQDQVLRAYAEYTEGRQGTNFILPPDVAARTEQLVRHRLVSLSVSSNASRQQIEAQSSMDPGSLVGREYRRASDEFAGSEQITIIMDPEKLARANRSHATLQNKFAQYLRDREITPRSPRADEPAFDIAWSYGSTTFVAEVKSLTNENEETQLRLGLGQALIYRQLLSERYTHAEAILFLEREPTMASWLKLCESIGVLMLWPDQLTSGHTSRLDEWMIARGGSVPVRPAFFEQR